MIWAYRVPYVYWGRRPNPLLIAVRPLQTCDHLMLIVVHLSFPATWTFLHQNQEGTEAVCLHGVYSASS